MNPWYETIMANNPSGTYNKNNPTGRSQYFASINNPYAYPPRHNPPVFDMFTQDIIVINRKRGLVIINDLVYGFNKVLKLKGTNHRHSHMCCYGFDL